MLTTTKKLQFQGKLLHPKQGPPNILASSFSFPFSFALWASQLAITCSKLTIETLEQSVKYVQG